MALDKSHWVGIISASVIIIISVILLWLKVNFFDMKTFYFVLGVAVIIAGMPFFTSLILEGRRERSIETMFIEFSRDLVEGVRAGTPISKSILNLRNKNYGSLDMHINKLANQIAIGIPVKDALETFSKDIRSPVISRAISLIREAEVAGGRIETILESVTFSISQIEKLKKERKAAIYSLTVQGYIIFLIFIAIMLVMQFKIIPILTDLGGINVGNFNQIGTSDVIDSSVQISAQDFANPFLFLLITQGFFAGLIIGKISEGTVKGGLKHSFVLVAISWIVSSGATLFLS